MCPCWQHWGAVRWQYEWHIRTHAHTQTSDVLIRRISNFRPYIRYGYGTVRFKTVLYGQNKTTVRFRYGTGIRSTVFWPFCRGKGGPGFESWSEPHFLLFPPIYFVRFLLNKAAHFHIICISISTEHLHWRRNEPKNILWCKNRRQSWSFWCQLGTFLVLIRAFKTVGFLSHLQSWNKAQF